MTCPWNFLSSKIKMLVASDKPEGEAAVALDQLVRRLERIAKKNHDHFHYKIEVSPRRNGGIECRFVCQEIADNHEFLTGIGATVDAAIFDAAKDVEEACKEWGYAPIA